MRARLSLAAALSLLLAAPARAAEPLPAGTWLLPGDGAARTASAWPAATPDQMIEFAVYLGDYDELPGALDVTVASSPATGVDGTLTDAVARYLAPPRSPFPDIYVARTPPDARWLGTAGTYYWQATYEDWDELYASPVRRLDVIAAPPPDAPQAVAPPVAPVVTPAPVTAPAPLAPGAARIIVRRAILAGTHRVHRGLTYRCTTAPGAATCRPSWRDARYRYRGTLRISAGTAGISATFDGTRAARSCARRCARAFSWTTTL